MTYTQLSKRYWLFSFYLVVLVLANAVLLEACGRGLIRSHGMEFKDIIIAGLRNKRPAEAICQAINRCGQLMGQHFPSRVGDVNELSNELRILEEWKIM